MSRWHLKWHSSQLGAFNALSFKPESHFLRFSSLHFHFFFFHLSLLLPVAMLSFFLLFFFLPVSASAFKGCFLSLMETKHRKRDITDAWNHVTCAVTSLPV
jgi:hypothetical protein